MKRTLRVLPDAEAELQSAATWYEEKRRGLGIELVAVVASDALVFGWIVESRTLSRLTRALQECRFSLAW